MAAKEQMSIMRVIYDRTRNWMLVVNMRVIYIRQNLASEEIIKKTLGTKREIKKDKSRKWILEPLKNYL